MDDQTKQVIESFNKRQQDCKHDQEFASGGSHLIPDSTGVMGLLQAIICVNCGKVFTSAVATNIRMAQTVNVPKDFLNSHRR